MPDDSDKHRPSSPPNPREEDIMAGDRRLSRPDSSLPDWEVPDTSYRPIPIVWFTGAIVFQMVALFAVFILLNTRHGYFTIAASAIITALLGSWTWDRGMKNAPTGWKIATFSLMALLFLLVCLSALPRT